MMYSGVTAGFLVAVLVLALDTRDPRRGVRRRGRVTMLGLTSTRGIHLAAWGVALLLLAAPIDDLWHRLFGLDVTLWSPPHLLGLLGSAVNTIGTLLIAVEAYSRGRSRMRLAALVLGGGLLYGGVRVVLEPAWLTAYTHGGVAFHAFAMLAALLLPLALIPGTRLLDRRWAPLVLVVISLAASLVGEQIARGGLRDRPARARHHRGDQEGPDLADRAGGRDPREEPRLRAAVGRPPHAAGLAAAVAGRGRPSPAARRRLHRLRRDDARAVRLVHRPDAGVPSEAPAPAETALALAFTVIAALIGSVAGRWIADVLQPRGGPTSASARPVTPRGHGQPKSLTATRRTCSVQTPNSRCSASSRPSFERGWLRGEGARPSAGTSSTWAPSQTAAPKPSPPPSPTIAVTAGRGTLGQAHARAERVVHDGSGDRLGALGQRRARNVRDSASATLTVASSSRRLDRRWHRAGARG